MRKTQPKGKSRRTPAELARERELREKYQQALPTLSQLAASGDYDPPVSQGNYWDLMKILARLRKLRNAAGLSLSEMAARTGIDRAALCRLENAVNDNPTIQTLNRYVGALGKRLVVKLEDDRVRPSRSQRK